MTNADIDLKPNQIITGNDVCPDLVSAAEYGQHYSSVLLEHPRWRGHRLWTFDSKALAEKFSDAVLTGSFRRKSPK